MDSPRSTVELKDDTVIVVLGASGDLAKKKTVCILGMAVLKTKAVQN
jgi:glucose-6-phosphate 1-dehydrogenase